MEQLADIAPTVQFLDDPVPLMVDQLVEVFRFVDIVLPEQVIDVPKISPGRIAQRFVDRDTQRVEQLVEVPTVVSPDLLAVRCPTTRTPRWTPRAPPYGDRRLAPALGWVPAECFELSSDDGRATGGQRPAALLEPRPQWSTSSTSCPTSRSSMCLCRRWATSWWNSCRGSTLRPLCWLSQCPRFLWTESRSVLWTGVVRRRRSSWWKCRPCLFPLSSSSLPSRSLTFQLRVVVGTVVEVFKVSSLQQQSAEQIVDIPVRNRGLQGFRLRQVSSASSAISRSAGEAFEVGISHREKVRSPAGSAESGRQVEFPRWTLIKWLVLESPRTCAHPGWRFSSRLHGI